MSVLQVLVYHDLLGMMQHPHYVKVTPKFCKQYANVGTVIQKALQSYRDEVQPLSCTARTFHKMLIKSHLYMPEALQSVSISRACSLFRMTISTQTQSSSLVRNSCQLTICLTWAEGAVLAASSKVRCCVGVSLIAGAVIGTQNDGCRVYHSQVHI